MGKGDCGNDLSSKYEQEIFFQQYDQVLTSFINSLIEFRLHKRLKQQQEISKFFSSIKIRAENLGYDELSKIGHYYEQKINSIEAVDDQSHELFSELLKATGVIKNHITEINLLSKKNKCLYDSKPNIEDIELKSTILILEQDTNIATVLGDAFKSEGYDVIVTDIPEEAIEYILYKNINICIMDIHTPKTNGFEVFEILKNNGLDIPVIFLGEKVESHFKVEVLSSGAEDYISKPFEIKEVVARVKRTLGRNTKYKNKLNKDNLTGAYTKEYFSEKIREISNANKHLNKIVSLAFIDLDDFKLINDTYGHVIGDYALKDFVYLLKSNLGENDIIFRFGGDEFIILFMDKDIDQTYDDIERLRKKINKVNFRYKDTKDIIKLKFSVGVTYINADDQVEEIIKRADKCLYESKKIGKNTTICSKKIRKSKILD